MRPCLRSLQQTLLLATYNLEAARVLSRSVATAKSHPSYMSAMAPLTVRRNGRGFQKLKQPDHNGGAGRLASASTAHDSLRGARQSLCDLEYLSSIRDEFGQCGSRPHTALEVVSSDAHSRRSHDQADRVCNFPPSALPHHFAKGF